VGPGPHLPTASLELEPPVAGEPEPAPHRSVQSPLRTHELRIGAPPSPSSGEGAEAITGESELHTTIQDRKAVAVGTAILFDEIQFDSVRFPESYRSLPAQIHPREAGDRTDAIASFLMLARKRLALYRVAISADVFGMSMNEAGDVGIGQQWERLSSLVDHILPMVYPSH